MITLTKNQFGQRWDTLPDILREALVSETNSDFIWSTCEAQNIPMKKYTVSLLILQQCSWVPPC